MLGVQRCWFWLSGEWKSAEGKLKRHELLEVCFSILGLSLLIQEGIIP